MPPLTIATINLRNRQDRWLKRRHLLVAQLVDTKPDLISLQEISFPIGQGRWLRNQLNARLSGLSVSPYWLIQKRNRHLIKGYYEGIGILGNLSVHYHDAISLGYGGRLAVRVNIELPSRQSLDFVTIQLHHIIYEKEAREEQIMRLLGWLGNQRTTTLQVIAGTFNELPEGPAIQKMKQVFRSAYEDVYGHEPLATFPTALVRNQQGWAGCLDYIFLSPAIKRPRSVSIFCDKPDNQDDTLFPSDHVGLIAVL